MMPRPNQLKYPIRSWTIWFLSAFFLFYKNSIEVSLSVMTATLMRTFNIGGAELGNLAACYFFAYLILQLPAGLFLDKFGARKTTTTAIFLCSLGTLIFSGANSIYVAGIGRFLTGIGAAFAVVNCLKLITNWFPAKQFAFMAGLMLTMGMLGSVGGQAPLAAFIAKMQWRFAIALLAAAGFFLAIIFWIVVRDKAPDHAMEKKIQPTNKMSLLSSVTSLLKNPQSWWLSIYSGFAYAPIMVFGGLWGVSFINKAFGITENLSAQMASLIFIGCACGAPAFGWFSDWLGRRKVVMLWGTVSALISISIVVYVPGIPIGFLAFLLFIFGFTISSFLLCFTMIREINMPMLAATAAGFMNAFCALVGAFSDPLAGKILDLRWDGTLIEGARIFSVSAYQTAFLILPVYLLISLISLIKIKETYCKPFLFSSDS